MDDELKEKISRFIRDGINETEVSRIPDPFWQNLKNTGTELRLVTKIENPDQKIVADSLKEVFQLITDLFINSANIEIRPK